MYGEEYGGFNAMIESQELRELVQSITFESKFLELYTADYWQALSYYYRFNVIKSFVKDYGINDWEEVNMETYLAVLDNIPKYSIPEEFKEFLLAFVAYESVQDTLSFNHTFGLLETYYPNSKYLSYLGYCFQKS